MCGYKEGSSDQEEGRYIPFLIKQREAGESRLISLIFMYGNTQEQIPT